MSGEDVELVDGGCSRQGMGDEVGSEDADAVAEDWAVDIARGIGRGIGEILEALI